MDTLALILVIIGALNWGLVGLFQFDLVASLFGGMSGTFARIIYTLVGLAGVWGISLLFRRDGIRHHDDSADCHLRKTKRRSMRLFILDRYSCTLFLFLPAPACRLWPMGYVWRFASYPQGRAALCIPLLPLNRAS